MKVAIIGGGAAGFFAAISTKKHHPNAQVILFEKTGKLLSKVKISGGGRCNVTHACFKVSELIKFYPRGGKQLKKAFSQFSTPDTIEWFESRNVPLKTEADNRMFPTSKSSQSIIDCLLREANKTGVNIQLRTPIEKIEVLDSGKFKLYFSNQNVVFDKVIVATGGSPKQSGFQWLANLGHPIQPPVPSLFTFNMPKEKTDSLMGLSVEKVRVKVQGTKLMQEGALLITHWGMSGPAILKLSAWGARVLADLQYQFKINVNWLHQQKEEELRHWLEQELPNLRKRKIVNRNPFQLPNRLWLFLLEKMEINPESTWGELGKKSLNRLINVLLNDEYEVRGKTTFKEEFVTCGGVALSEIDFQTMQSRKIPNLYFVGEVLDIDGVTGGFNFQAAWSTGFVAGKLSI